MLRVLIAIFLTTIGSAANADNGNFIGTWEIYRKFLREPTCGDAKDYKICDTRLMEWKRDIHWALEGAYIGQRNVSYCLSTGCDDAVIIHPILACAWAKVILLSGHPEIKTEDVEIEEQLCGSVALSKPMERQAAAAQARVILGLLAAE